MADPRFFNVPQPINLKQLAEISGAEIADGADGTTEFTGVQPLAAASAEHVSFLDNKLYLEDFRTSSAGACLVDPAHADEAPEGMALLLSPEPYRAYAKVASAFHPSEDMEPEIHVSASVDETASLGNGVRLDAGAVVQAGCEIGDNCHIGANSVIGSGCVIGSGSRIGPCATVSHCIMGQRVIVHSGVRIGQDGFGFALGAEGHLKVPQLGRVIIGDDVEIGANSTIDRGAGPDTVIGDGTKIDNLVQIAHNVEIGKGCIIVSQVGISGSTKVGNFVMMGGQAGLTGHLRIGDGARIAAQSGVMRDIQPGGTVGGSPAKPMRNWLKEVAIVERLAKKKGS